MTQRIPFHSVVKSKVSGFKGMVTSHAKHANGCDRYWVQPTVDKDGKNVDGAWFDCPELVVVKLPKPEKAAVMEKARPGGFPSTVK